MPTAYETAVLTDSPVGWWKCNEASGTTLADSAGSNPMTVTGSPAAYGWAGERTNGAGILWPNNTGVYARPATAWTDTASFSIEAWVKISANPAAQLTVVTQGDSTTGSSNNERAIFVNTSGVPQAAIWNGSSTTTITHQSSLSLNVWHHLVLTRTSAGLAALYVDGFTVAGATGAGTITSGRGLYIHAGYNAGASYGAIADVATYNQCLTSTQVATHYAAATIDITYRDAVLSESQGVAGAGLLCYYRLNDASGTTMTDASPNARSGTYNAGYTLAQPGLLATDSDKAVVFNGTSGNASTTYSTWMDLASAVTVEAWVKTSQTTGLQAILHRDGPSSQIFQFRLNAGKPEFIRVPGTTVTAAGPTSVADGKAHHLVATYDGATIKMYVDGIQVASAAATGGVGVGALPITIGAGYGGGSSLAAAWFNGTLDEVAYYNTVLNADRILLHYMAGSASWADTASGDVTGANWTRNGNSSVVGTIPPYLQLTNGGSQTASALTVATFPLTASGSITVEGYIGTGADTWQIGLLDGAQASTYLNGGNGLQGSSSFWGFSVNVYSGNAPGVWPWFGSSQGTTTSGTFGTNTWNQYTFSWVIVGATITMTLSRDGVQLATASGTAPSFTSYRLGFGGRTGGTSATFAALGSPIYRYLSIPVIVPSADALSDASAVGAVTLVAGSGSGDAASNATATGLVITTAVTNNGVGGRERNAFAVASWAPPVVVPPAGTAAVAYDVAQSFSTPAAGGSSAPWQPVYTVTESKAKRHRHRVLIGGYDITWFRGVLTPEPDYQLIEPLLYSTATIELPQVRVAFERPGSGALTWLKKGAAVTIQRVDVDTNAVVAADYVGLVISFSVSGDHLAVNCGGEVQGRLAMIDKQVELRNYDKDIGWFAWYWFSNWRLPFLPAQGPITGAVLGTSGGVAAVDYIQDIVTQAQSANGARWTIMPGIGAAAGTASYGMATKDTTTIHGTVYLDDARCVGNLESDLSEEPNRIFATAVGPEGRRIRGAVYPGLQQGTPPAWPGGTLSPGATGGVVPALNSRLIVAGYLNSVDVPDNNTWGSSTTVAVKAFRNDVGNPGTTMTSALWNTLFDLSATSYSMTNSHIEPMAQANSVRPWNLTGSGAVAGRNPAYDPSIPWVDRSVDMGTGFKKSTVKAWAQAELADAFQANWVGTIEIFMGAIPAGNHTPGNPISSILRTRDIKPGMNLALPLFMGGIIVHVSGVSVKGASDTDLGSVQLQVDTRARDALEVWQIVERNRESRKSPARRWIENHRNSTQVNDAINEWDDVGGQIDSISLTANQWNVFPVVAGQEGQVERLHMSTSPNAQWCMAVFGKKIHRNQLTQIVGNPFTVSGKAKWSNAAARSQLDDTFVLLYAAGTADEPCGYYPGNLANSDALTGNWRDDATFAYRTFDGPVLWVAVWPDRATTLPAGRIMWNQIGAGV